MGTWGKQPDQENTVEVTWRERLRRFWRDYWWVVLVSLWVAVLALGIIGFSRYYRLYRTDLLHRSFWDNVYNTLQLFVFESGSLTSPMPWQLEVARVLAPALAVFTAIQALLIIFFEHMQHLRMRFFRKHVVVCGLGRKGSLFSTEFSQKGFRVVLVEQEERNKLIKECRTQGAVVLIGDASDKVLLERARVQKARYLICVCGNDAVNAAIAANARELTENLKGGSLTCLVHIVDVEFCNVLRGMSVALSCGDAFRLEFFNVFDSGARILLDEYPPYNVKGAPGDARSHPVVVGMGALGKSLFAHSARGWVSARPSADARLPVTIVDRDCEAAMEALRSLYPKLDDVCELTTVQMDTESSDFRKAGFLHDPEGKFDATTIYVCLDDDSAAFYAVLALLPWLRGREVPIVVRVTHGLGLVNLAKTAEGYGYGVGNLHAFSLLDSACGLEMLLGGIHETLAIAIHKEYVHSEEVLGQTPETNPSMVPWNNLPESLKESNRKQAGHIAEKLEAVGYVIGHLTDWEQEPLQFTPEQIEVLAEMEHERWVVERQESGWKYAAGGKDIQERTSPYLVPWGQLDEDVKEVDRNTVRALPVFLARAGFQLCPVLSEECRD